MAQEDSPWAPLSGGSWVKGAEAMPGTGLKLLHPLPGSEQSWEKASTGILRVRSTDW